MEKEKRRENKQSRKSENFGKKWKLLASVWVLMLAFLLVPGMKSEAAAKTKISAPKSVKMYFTTGENYKGSTMSTLAGQGYIFMKNMPKNGTIQVLSCTNSKVQAVAGDYMFPYGGYQNGIMIRMDPMKNAVLKNKEKAVVTYKVKTGKKSYTYKTTITFMKTQNPVKSISINGEKCSLKGKKTPCGVGGNIAHVYDLSKKNIDRGTPAKIHVDLKPGYKLAKIEVFTWPEDQPLIDVKVIANDEVVTDGVWGIRVFYYTSLPHNFKQSYYKRDKRRDGDITPRFEEQNARRERIYWAKYRVVNFDFAYE